MWGTARARAVPDAEPLGSATPSCVKEATTKDPGEGDEGGSLCEVPTGFISVKGATERGAKISGLQRVLNGGWYKTASSVNSVGGEHEGWYKELQPIRVHKGVDKKSID